MTATIQTQLEREEHMIEEGRRRYNASQESAVRRDPAASGSGSSLINHYMPQVSEHIELFMAGKHPEGRRRTAHARLVSGLTSDAMAYFTLRAMIGCLFSDERATHGGGSGSSAQSTFISLGRSCEDELRFSKFEIEHPDLHKHLFDAFERNNTTSVSHKRSVLTGVSPTGFEWESWTAQDRFKVGGLLFGLAAEVTDIVTTNRRNTRSRGGKHRTVFELRPTESVLEWMTKHGQFCEDLRPDRIPCVVPPAPWTSWTDGGYYTPRLRARTPLIKGRVSTKEKRNMYQSSNMPAVFDAVNALQGTAWQVNKQVLDVARIVWHGGLGAGLPQSQPLEVPPCPLQPGDDLDSLPEDDPLRAAFEEWKAVAADTYTRETKRYTQSMAVHRIMRVAADFEDGSPLWFVWQLCFRSRAYSASGALTPQGMDLSKGLLRFHKAKPLRDEEGLNWFLINGANKYGFDKAPYADRVQWCHTNEARWTSVAEDPIRWKHIWGEADKPFQFLAWCFEYAAMMKMDNPLDFCSHLPVGMDGSCNGLQHFSAMLRDPIGGAAVNLVPTDKPADIYGRVADRLHEKLTALRHTEPMAARWLEVLGDSVPRKLMKPPVMTLPYGSTQRTCTQTTMAWVLANVYDEFEENTAFLHCIWLTPLIWTSIGEIVVAAREAMSWIQRCCSVSTKAGKSLVYYTALGFPVVQENFMQEKIQIRTQLHGDLQLKIAVDTDRLSGQKQRNSASPNLVHSADATHMMMSVLAAKEVGIEDFAMIHDDFGCHACDAAEFNKIIRNTFADLHTQTSVLGDFSHWLEAWSGKEMPDMPDAGSLDMNAVRDAAYFFG